MARFTNLNKNKNNNSSLDELTTIGNNHKTKAEPKFKNLIVKLPIEYHSKLKFELSAKHNKNMNALILDALLKVYPELK